MRRGKKAAVQSRRVYLKFLFFISKSIKIAEFKCLKQVFFIIPLKEGDTELNEVMHAVVEYIHKL